MGMEFLSQAAIWLPEEHQGPVPQEVLSPQGVGRGRRLEPRGGQLGVRIMMGIMGPWVG